MEYSLTMFHDKPKALEVKRLGGGAKAPEAPDPEPRLGRVRWFDVGRKYGFLVPLEGGPDVCVSRRVLFDLRRGII